MVSVFALQPASLVSVQSLPIFMSHVYLYPHNSSVVSVSVSVSVHLNSSVHFFEIEIEM